MKNPNPEVKTCLIWFANFYKLANSNEHTYETVRKIMNNPKKLLTDVIAFDYDAVSGPSVKRIKSYELYSPQEMMKTSVVVSVFAKLLICAQDYYMAKTAKAKAVMREIEQ